MGQPRSERFFEKDLVEYTDTNMLEYFASGQVLQVSLGLQMDDKVMFDDEPGCWYHARLRVDFVSGKNGENYVEWVKGGNALSIRGGFNSLFSKFVNYADSIYAMLRTNGEDIIPLKKDLISSILKIEAQMNGEFMDAKNPSILRRDLQDKLIS